MHKVLRTFTAGRGRVKVGKIVDGSQYRNLGFLVRKGYLAPVEGDVAADPIDEVYVEFDAEKPVETSDETTATDETEIDQPAATGDILDQVAAQPIGEPLEKPAGRVVIVGGPGSGKTTLAIRMGGGRSTDETAELEWSDASQAVSEWFDQPGPWLIEGVAVARALRKWRENNPESPAPVDRVIYLHTRFTELEPDAEAMGKGIDTVMDEILPWLLQTAVVDHVAEEPDEDLNEPSLSFDAAVAQLEIDPVTVNSKAKLLKTRKDDLIAIARLMGHQLVPDDMSVAKIVDVILGE